MSLLHGFERDTNGALQVQDGELAVTRTMRRGVPISDANELIVKFVPASPSGTTVRAGTLFASDGAPYISTAAPQSVEKGVGYRTSRALCVTFDAPANTARRVWVDGIQANVLANTDGQVHVGGLTFVLDLPDLGGGVAGLVPLTANNGISATFTRATAAASKLSTGLWKLDVASGSARYSYNGLDTTVTTTGGYLPEGLRINSCLQARDLTNASWTKTTMTTAKTSTGIDGVTNSCTRCTASAGNGTALQAVVLASAAKAFGVWIKRITGTGEIDITLDNGSTWTNITSQINASTFTLVQATQTLANPTVGIRIVTSTDAIDVDVAQLEDGAAFSSTPIPTTVAAVTRNADVLTYLLTGWYNTLAGTMLANYTNANVALISSVPWEIYTDNNNYLTAYRSNAASLMDVFNASVQQVGISIAATQTTGGAEKLAAAWSANDFALVDDGGTVGTDAAGTIPAVTTLSVGLFGSGGGSAWMYGPISRIAYSSVRNPNAVLQQMTT